MPWLPAGPAFERAWAAVEYAGPARELVLALKGRGAHAAAGLIASQIAARVPAGLIAGGVLVPVPGQRPRTRARGFDHAERIAAALGARSALPVARCLTRTDAGERQAGSDRRSRLACGRVVVHSSGVAPARAVLVDDVHTTGATLRACAAALRAGGAQSVVAVTYARTLSGGADKSVFQG